MWRAFFFATGISLLLLGTQCLFVEHFQVADSTRMPKIVTKLLDSRLLDNPSSQSPQAGSQNGFGLPAGQFNGGQLQKQGYSMPAASTGSPYGPSRFESPYGGSNTGQSGYYGGVPSTNQQQPFSLAGFGNRANQPMQVGMPAASTGPTNVFGEAVNSKVLTTKEWMPWSLLAAGTLVVLYTKGTKGSFNRE